MEKLKFTLQVFTAIAALPVLTMMELKHDPQRLASQEITKQLNVKPAQGTQTNNAGKNMPELQKKNFTRLYVK